MGLEPDHRPPDVDHAKEVDWDNLKATYEVPGARDAVPDVPPIPDVRSTSPKDNWAWEHDDWGWEKPKQAFPAPNRDAVSELKPLSDRCERGQPGLPLVPVAHPAVPHRRTR